MTSRSFAFGALSLACVLLAAEPVPAEETAAGAPVRPAATTLHRFTIAEARQAVAVDATAFYAIDNATIAKYDRKTGELLKKWQGPKGGPVLHMDSGVVVDGRLYTAHSNYPDWPMISSVEIWDATTLDHVGSHSFGIDRGSFTWLDRDPQGRWWGAFANYNRVFDKSPVAYGNKYTTQLVRFDADWRVVEAFVYPDALVERFKDMSNSGGGFGPDGRLYVTGHDNPELYVLEPPKFGSVMVWVETIPIELGGQGFAFDRSEPGVVWGIVRKPGAGSQVTTSRLP